MGIIQCTQKTTNNTSNTIWLAKPAHHTQHNNRFFIPQNTAHSTSSLHQPKKSSSFFKSTKQIAPTASLSEAERITANMQRRV